jgi:hypothetical protein
VGEGELETVAGLREDCRDHAGAEVLELVDDEVVEVGVGRVSAAWRKALVTRAPRRCAGSPPKPERSRQRFVPVSMSLRKYYRRSRLPEDEAQGQGICERGGVAESGQCSDVANCDVTTCGKQARFSMSRATS